MKQYEALEELLQEEPLPIRLKEGQLYTKDYAWRHHALLKLIELFNEKINNQENDASS
jgi:hypothetical protein